MNNTLKTLSLLIGLSLGMLSISNASVIFTDNMGKYYYNSGNSSLDLPRSALHIMAHGDCGVSVININGNNIALFKYPEDYNNSDSRLVISPSTTESSGSYYFNNDFSGSTITLSGSDSRSTFKITSDEYLINFATLDGATWHFINADGNLTAMGLHFDELRENGDFIFTASPIPEASEVAIFLGVAALGFVAYRRKK